jgi:prepilin-type N-terminal cleavage/methylation domain-containing protein
VLVRDRSRQDGFTLVELLISTTITLLALGGAVTTFKNALNITNSGTQLSDSNQNLRAGTNLLVRDLMQAGRQIPTGGIPIPSGIGSTLLNRPSPPGVTCTFDNVNATALAAITTGADLGPTIANSTTDMVTMLMMDPLLPRLDMYALGTVVAGNANPPYIANDGASFTFGNAATWASGDAANGIAGLNIGDLVYFTNSQGSTVQTVTRMNSTAVFFDANDWFNFNQPGAASGTITQLKPAGGAYPQTSAFRLQMVTYYVDAATTPGSPRLTRVQNHYAPQALAGVVEDLDLSYDLVDASTNPTGVRSLPYVLNGLTYTSNQIRKANLHVGVRSDQLSVQANDYIRNHVSTIISIRDLATLSRYQ